MFFYIPTSKGYPVLFLADTTLYNQYSSVSSQTFLQTLTDFSDFEEALDGLRTLMGQYGITNLPPLTMGTVLPASQSPALVDDINRVASRFPISVISPATIISNNYLGVSYGPVTVRLEGNADQADCYLDSTTLSGSTCYANMRNFIVGGTIHAFGFSVHLIPENAISENGTLIGSQLGTYDNPLLFRAGYNSATAKFEAYVTIGNNRRTPTTASKNLLNNIAISIPEPPVSSEDPYTAIVGGSTTGGGGGSGDFTGQTIGEPSLPTVTALNSGFISAYAPSVSNLNQLASYMWTSDFSDNLKKVFGDNPMNTILGLSCVPVQPPLGGGSTVILGNIDTGISMPTIGAQYTKVNCGSIAIEPKYGAFLDYEPYTSIDLFLPYIGMVQLSTNDVMGKSLGVVYTVDVLSGACVANVSCGGSIMYTFEGACATQFPVTNNDYSNVFKAAVDAASSIVGAVGGAVASGMTGNIAGAVTSIVDGAAGAATAAMNAHPTVNRSGSLSGSAGLMGIQHPFIVWTTPNMVASNRQNSFIGYPNFITTTLSGCAGYTEVENINLGIAGATSEEIAEIKTLLKNGVIF